MFDYTGCCARTSRRLLQEGMAVLAEVCQREFCVPARTVNAHR